MRNELGNESCSPEEYGWTNDAIGTKRTPQIFSNKAASAHEQTWLLISCARKIKFNEGTCVGTVSGRVNFVSKS